MTVRIHTLPPVAKPCARASLAACLGVAGLVLVAGCGTAPPGAAGNSPAIGPLRAVAATNFAPFAVPTAWNGNNNTVYKTLLKAVTGLKPREFHITVGSDMVFWLSCLGKGTARVSNAEMGLNWSVACGTGDDPSAVDFSPTGAVVGSKVKLLVTATPGARWEIRIDVPASALASLEPTPTPAPTPTPVATRTAA